MPMLISLWSVETWMGSNICARELSLAKSLPSGCHAMPRLQCIPVVLSAGNYPSEFEVNASYTKGGPLRRPEGDFL